MVAQNDEESLEEKILDVLESLFPSGGSHAVFTYDDFVNDVVAPRVARLPLLCAVSDILEAVEAELEARFGSTVSVHIDEDVWLAVLEKMGEDAELFLDKEGTNSETEEEEIYLSNIDTDEET